MNEFTRIKYMEYHGYMTTMAVEKSLIKFPREFKQIRRFYIKFFCEVPEAVTTSQSQCVMNFLKHSNKSNHDGPLL